MTQAQVDSLLRAQQAREAEIRDSLERVASQKPIYATLAERE